MERSNLEFAEKLKQNLVLLEGTIRYLEVYFSAGEEESALDKIGACVAVAEESVRMVNTLVEKERREYLSEFE